MIISKYRKSCSIFLVFTIVLGLTACGGSKGKSKTEVEQPEVNSNEPVELTIYSYSKTPGNFEQWHGNFVRKNFPNYTIKFIERAKEGDLTALLTAGVKIDIVYDAVQTFQRDMLKYEIGYDMTELLKKNKFDLNRIEPTILNKIKQMPGINALPFLGQIMVLYYNKEVFNKFGVPYPKDGMTWDEAIALGHKMTRVDGGTQYYGFASSITHNLFYNQFSLPNVDIKTTLPTINTDERWKTLMNTMVLPFKSEYTTAKAVPGLNVFRYEHKVAMYPYQTSWLNVADPRYTDLDMVSLPIYKELPGVGSQNLPVVAGITNTTKKTDAALKLLLGLASDESQTMIARGGDVPIVTSDAIKKQTGNDAAYPNLNYYGAYYSNKFASLPPTPPYDGDVGAEYVKGLTELAIGSQTDMNTLFRSLDERAKKIIEEKK